MLTLKKISTAFVLSLILGVSLFSTGAFAKSTQSAHTAHWCGCSRVIVFVTGSNWWNWDFGFFPWFHLFGW